MSIRGSIFAINTHQYLDDLIWLEGTIGVLRLKICDIEVLI